MSTLWIGHGGKVLVNGSGKLIECDHCPCGDPCDVCCFGTLHVKVTARTRVWVYDDPDNPGTSTISVAYDETTTAEVNLALSRDDAGYATPNCAYHNYTGYVYCDPDTTQSIGPCDPETTQSVDPEGEDYCAPYCNHYGGGSLFDAGSYGTALEIPTGILFEVESTVTCEDGTPHGDDVCQFVLSQLNLYRKDGTPIPDVAELAAAPFVLNLPLVAYFGYWSGTYHPFGAGGGPLSGPGTTVRWGDFPANFFQSTDGNTWDTLPFAPGIDPTTIQDATTEYWVELWQV